MDVLALAKEIIDGRRLTREDDLSFFLTCDLDDLCKGADQIREARIGDKVDLCSIINGRSGRCPEDCKYCAQSAHHHTNCEIYDFLPEEKIVELCKLNESEGVNRFSIVTGTGTDTGKTYITGLIVKKLQEAKKNPAYYKAAMSGNDRRPDGTLIPGDALAVQTMSGIDQSLTSMCPYVYEHAYSPHLASRLEGNPVVMDVVTHGFADVTAIYDYVTVEGSGGILCPICFDEARIQLEDVVKELHLSSILIADAGLGTINSVVLTAEYMKTHGLPLKGIIFNHYHPGDVMEDDNIFMCEHMTGLPTLAKVQDDDTELDMNIDALCALYDEVK